MIFPWVYSLEVEISYREAAMAFPSPTSVSWSWPLQIMPFRNEPRMRPINTPKNNLLVNLKTMDGGEQVPADILKRKCVLIRVRFITEIAMRLFARKHISICWELAAPIWKMSEIIWQRMVYRDFIAGLENNSTLKSLKYDAFRKLWYQLTPYVQIMSPRTDLCDAILVNVFGTAYSTILARKRKQKIY
ncbi:765_t:CDS:2 [Diversispora eburnea]|uniref:765_t:CDS:1 n=1 Tax=Diversispora eburnea TaxID=1213867 RepID=A0A9N8V084_9GLOM|nr:765_t:CDS:2 [Diversispora eburnea]